MSTLKLSLLIGLFGVIVSLVHCAPSSDEISTAARRCPPGMVYSEECIECGGTITCANPNPIICPLVCATGCTCAEGTILDEETGKCVETCPLLPIRCPNGFVFARCLSCGNRPLTCDDHELTLCSGICLPGCDCPEGQVLDLTAGKCVSKECQKCPFDGQVFKRCVNCPRNPFTCDSPFHPCTRDCLPGCECPFGEVLDLKGGRCVPLEECSLDN
ncbi:hypothetical protein EMCRGX_G007474 [Ephydatia muelleri]|eukprot:Em0002g1003a